jgi:hypothetical protein
MGMVRFPHPQAGPFRLVWWPVYEVAVLALRALNEVRLRVVPVGTRGQVELIHGRMRLLLSGGVILVEAGSEVFFHKKLTYQQS